MGRVALVTGANQGLGLALVKGLCARLGAGDVVYLTARDEAKGRSAMATLGEVAPDLRFERVDVTDDASVAAGAAAIRARHRTLDIVISNAAARIAKDVPAADQVAAFVDTNNHGTVRMLRRFLPLLARDGRFVVVASSFGRLAHLPEHLRRHFDTATAGLDGIEAVMRRYAADVQAGTASGEGWPDWINVASKIGQVAAARIAARTVADERPGDGILVNAACPGLVDTEASRPWFADMSRALSPEAAAVDVLWLATLPAGTTAPHGELVQHRTVLDWGDA